MFIGGNSTEGFLKLFGLIFAQSASLINCSRLSVAVLKKGILDKRRYCPS
jgi:hypothetical protein